jgi:hypothetical protein
MLHQQTARMLLSRQPAKMGENNDYQNSTHILNKTF